MSIYLVTGAAGFIGSAITSALVSRGDTVRGLDNLSTGCIENLAGIREKIEFTVGDLRDEALLALLCEGVDVIFHEAAAASVQQSIEDPLGTWDVNVEGTRRLIAAATKAGVRRIVFASSSAVYGDAACQPVDEDNALAPLSPYAAHKLACELLLQQAHEESTIETVSLRYFHVFGPRQSGHAPNSGAVARFFYCMNRPSADAPATLFGDGASTRDFIFVDDVVAVNLAAAEAEAASVSGRAFNIGSGQRHTIREVAHAIGELSRFPGPYVNEPARAGEIRHSVADIRLARRLLGFQPAIPFAEGLRRISLELCLTPRTALSISRPAVKALAGSTRRRAPANTVAHAIANQEFSLAFQPIVHLPSGRPLGVEALLRHKFEDQNRAPLRIIRQAEATGTDFELGAWCLLNACQAAVRLQAAFDSRFRMSVNASLAQLENMQFVPLVQQILSSTGLSPQSLEIEITERILITQGRVNRHNLRKLQEMGVSIALDDFGCGQANLQHLCKLKVDRLKTDRTILRGSSRSWPIFDGLVAFVRKLQIPLVAEGVETRSQLDKVLRTGCKEAQGYLFSRPTSIENLLAFAAIQREVA